MRRALLLPLLALLMGAGPSVLLELPDPLRLEDYADQAEVGQGIAAALVAKKWVVESDTGTAITARFEARESMLRVRIEYTTERVRYRYVDSTGLGYTRIDGEDYIHPAANKWLSRLAKQVRETQEFLRPGPKPDPPCDGNQEIVRRQYLCGRCLPSQRRCNQGLRDGPQVPATVQERTPELLDQAGRCIVGDEMPRKLPGHSARRGWMLGKVAQHLFAHPFAKSAIALA